MTHELTDTNVRWFMDSMMNTVDELEEIESQLSEDLEEVEEMMLIADLQIKGVRLQFLAETYTVLTQDMDEDVLEEYSKEYESLYENEDDE